MPSGQAPFSGPKKAGRGQLTGVRSFLTMPSASARLEPEARPASMKSSKATTRSIQGQAGASGISSAVMMPVVP